MWTSAWLGLLVMLHAPARNAYARCGHAGATSESRALFPTLPPPFSSQPEPHSFLLLAYRISEAHHVLIRLSRRCSQHCHGIGFAHARRGECAALLTCQSRNADPASTQVEQQCLVCQAGQRFSAWQWSRYHNLRPSAHQLRRFTGRSHRELQQP